MNIRAARLEDAERLREINAWYVNHTAVSFDLRPPTSDAFRDHMARRMAKYPWLVAEEAGRIQGYACAGPFVDKAAYDWSCETTIYLDHAARGRGLGRALYAALETALGEMGIVNLYACIAWADPEDGHLTQASPRFHARMGYREAGRFARCGYKFGRWYDMIWMEKQIGDNAAAPRPLMAWRGGESL